jgi:hypothetical protein
MARTLARDLRIDQIFPANRHFGQQPSNPRAEVRLLPGPSWLFMRNRVRDAGHMELRGAGVRPLKTAGDRLTAARTGAHRVHSLAPERARGTPDASSQPSVPSSSAKSAHVGVSPLRDVHRHAAVACGPGDRGSTSSSRCQPERHAPVSERRLSLAEATPLAFGPTDRGRRVGSGRRCGRFRRAGAGRSLGSARRSR